MSVMNFFLSINTQRSKQNTFKFRIHYVLYPQLAVKLAFIAKEELFKFTRIINYNLTAL